MRKRLIFIAIVFLNIFIVSVIANESIWYQAYKSDAKIIINGNEPMFKFPVVTIDDRTYVALRDVANYLDKNVSWDENENKIILSDKYEKLLMLSFFYQDDWEIPAYRITVYDNDVYEVSERRTTTFSMPSIKKETFYLEKSEISEMKRLLNEITADYSQSYALFSRGWTVALSYNDQYYPYNFGYYKSEYMEELINMLIELSPIEIPAEKRIYLED